MADKNFEKLVRALTTPIQDAENLLQAMYTERWVTTAVGAQLDLVGGLVGRPRQGVADDEIYRRYCRAQIAANKSDGLTEDIITISDLVVFDDAATYVVKYGGTGSVHARVDGVAVDPDVAVVLASILRRAAAGGVRLITETSDVVTVDQFAFDGTDTAKGFASLPELDLTPITTNTDTIIRYRDSVQDATLAIVADGTGAGSLANNGNAWTFHFESGVTTVAQFESAVNASSHLVVRTVDGVGTMGAGDAIAATAFTIIEGGGALASAMT